MEERTTLAAYHIASSSVLPVRVVRAHAAHFYGAVFDRATARTQAMEGGNAVNTEADMHLPAEVRTQAEWLQLAVFCVLLSMHPAVGVQFCALRQLVAAHLLVLRCYAHNSMANCTIWIPSCMLLTSTVCWLTAYG